MLYEPNEENSIKITKVYQILLFFFLIKFLRIYFYLILAFDPIFHRAVFLCVQMNSVHTLAVIMIFKILIK